jgi:hypothetical protein
MQIDPSLRERLGSRDRHQRQTHTWFVEFHEHSPFPM